MEFLHLNAFYLLIFPLFLLIFILFKKEKTFENYFDKNILNKITISNNFLNKNIKNTLLLFSFLLIILAIARPVMDKKEHKIKESLIPIIVAIDVSKSMLANDIYPNRLELAKQKLLQFIQNSKDSAIGVVLFAKSAFVLSPITQDFTSLTFLVKNLDSGLNFDNGSNILAMLEASNDLLENYNSKNVILLSDGGNKDSYDKEIDFALQENIKTYIIGIASSKLAPIPIENGYLTDNNGKIVTVGLNENISELGLKSKGGYINFSLNSDDIDAIFNDILSQAKKEQMSSTKIKTYTELFYYPLGIALFLLFICFSSLPSKKTQTTLLSLFVLCLFTKNLNAGIFDFKILEEAKQQYENSKFNEAEKLYKQVDKNQQSKYNLANSLYKQEKYNEALQTYKSIKTEDINLKYNTLHNIGNSYVKQNDLENAKISYEKALQLSQNEQTKQNLELVKKALENKKNKKDNKNSDDKKEDKKQKDNKDNKNSQKKNDDKKNKNIENKKEENKESKEDKAKKEDLEKKNQEKSEKEEKSTSNSKQLKSEEKIDEKLISDMEEKKWLNQIKNRKNQTFLRKVESKNTQEDNIKNPW